jgi:hypothetical protein
MYGAEIKISDRVKVVIEVSGGNQPDDAQKALIEACSFWQAIPEVCPMPGCGAPLHFTARHPQSYHYYGVMCEGPKPHEMTFGERKDHTSLYIKEDGWKDAYGGGDQGNEPASASSQPAQSSPTGDKIKPERIRMIEAVAKAKKPQPDLNNLAKELFGKVLTDCTVEEGDAVLEYVKSL